MSSPINRSLGGAEAPQSCSNVRRVERAVLLARTSGLSRLSPPSPTARPDPALAVPRLRLSSLKLDRREVELPTSRLA